jgi:hypothetical protein
MSYPYSSFYLEAQWSRIKVAEHFDFGTGCPLSAIGWRKCLRPAVDCQVSLVKTEELTSI